MGMKDHVTPDVVEKHCGRINVDIRSGWELGLGPKQKVGSRVMDHTPPEHLTGPRYQDWSHGYEQAKAYKKRHLEKTMVFVGANSDGEVRVVRQGWSTSRGDVVSSMAKSRGCFGDVNVYYMEGTNIARTVNVMVS